MVNVGMIGLGFMGATHLRAYPQVPNAKVLALCSHSGRHLDGDFSDVAGNLGDAEPLKLDMSGIRTFRDYDEMLADPGIQLIDICTPTHSHFDLVIKALNAGKHVLCEKPMARTSKEAEEMIAAARKAVRILMPGLCLRFLPSWSIIREAILDQRFGKVLGARFRRVGEPPAWGQDAFLDGAKSGGALLDLHIHDIDFVQFCFGAPKSVYAQGYTGPSGAIDYVMAQYRCANDLTVSAEGAWTMTPGFGFTMEYTVNFERATLDFDMTRGENALRLIEQGNPPQILKPEGPDGYVGEIAHLVEAIEGNTQPTVLDAEDALNATRICEAEQRSIETREIIRL